MSLSLRRVNKIDRNTLHHTDMTRDNFDKAAVALDKIAKLKAMREKIKHEFPEFEYDKQAKEVGDAIFNMIDASITVAEKQFKEL